MVEAAQTQNHRAKKKPKDHLEIWRLFGFCFCFCFCFNRTRIYWRGCRQNISSQRSYIQGPGKEVLILATPVVEPGLPRTGGDTEKTEGKKLSLSGASACSGKALSMEKGQQLEHSQRIRVRTSSKWE